jgi:beta-glucosidase
MSDPLASAEGARPSRPAFRDPTLPLEQRVADLLGRLTLAEKTALLHQHQPAIPRLGIGAFRTGTEALHGLAWLGPATVFPQPVGLASTWNLDLVRAVGAAVGDEVRGFHHKDPARCGLNVWAPVVNPLRDPRWGRNEEGYSEDPYLTGAIANAYASGLRGDHPRVLKTAPTLKHFLGYNNETRRETTSSNLRPRVLHEYELPAFRAPIAAGAAVAVMASYNLVNGRPAHLSPLINDELRRWTSEELLVVSDAAAPSNVATTQGYYPNHVVSHAALVRAGVDSFTDNDDQAAPTIERLSQALAQGLITEADIEQAARRVLTIRFRLGEFDPVESNPYATITEEVINCPAHQRLAREAASQALVLLKNSDSALPIEAGSPGRIAVIGPLADTLYEDWYSGTLPYAVTAYRGLVERLGPANVELVEGLDRIALRVGRAIVVASADPGGAPLRLVIDEGGADRSGREAGLESAFDLADWGNGLRTLRAAANGRHVSVSDDGVLVNDRPRPGGWVVRETFRLTPVGDGQSVLHHVASGRYVVADAEGALFARAETPEEATLFTVELRRSGRSEAARAARAADVAIVVVGNHPLINGRETEDRTDLSLPPAQEGLLRAVHAANPRTVLVVQSSYPYAIDWAQEHVPAIVWSSHGGQEFGHALADALFGDTSPAGRLTQTWYRSAAQLPDLLDYDIIAADATYLYFRGTPLYPFGHGLTYTTFEYSGLRLSADRIPADGRVAVTFTLTNTGARVSDEVVQLYTRQEESRVKQPLRQLRAFRRVRLAPGESTTVSFELTAADLATWDVTRGRPVVEAAHHTVLIGSSSMDIRLAALLWVEGERVPPWAALEREIPAVGYDDYAGIDLRDLTPEHGDAVVATEPGAWIAIVGVDFGAGAGSCRARVSATDDRTAVITLRLDDPLEGPVIGSLSVACTGGRYSWVEAHTALDGATGVRDLYVVFDAAGVALDTLAFARP